MADDKLKSYREKRTVGETPEPGLDERSSDEKGGRRFVIQQHAARRLHWDLRLEHEGVLLSWALPRGIPMDPDADRLAVHTEDHPIEYIDFHGEIPAGQYGAGTMTIWDSGVYQPEKLERGKLVVSLAGERVRGRYSLFQTRGDDWMIHRMDATPADWEPLPAGLEPMRASEGRLLPRDDAGWGFEIDWEGARVLAHCPMGHLELRRHGEDLRALFPEVRGMLAQLDGTEALFDGVLVCFGKDGRPDRTRLERRLGAEGDSQVRRGRRDYPATLVIFDALHLGGRSLLRETYEARREALAKLELAGDSWQVPAHHVGDGAALRDASRAQGLGGILAKRLASSYEPGAESDDWRLIAA